MISFKKNKIREKFLNEFGFPKDELYNLERIESYFRDSDYNDSFYALSDKTCNDLDFDELFKFVDRTYSIVGQQFLYRKLRTIPNNSDDSSKNEIIIKELSDNINLRLQVQILLSRLNNSNAYYIHNLFQGKQIKAPKWFFIVNILFLSSIASLIISFFNIKFIFLFAGIFIINMIIHYWNKKNLFQYLYSLPQLLKLSAVANELFKFDCLKNINPSILKSIKALSKIKIRMSFFKFGSITEGDMQVIVWTISEIFKIAFIIEPILLFQVIKKIDLYKKDIEQIFEFVGEIDSLLSVSSLRSGLEFYCIPDIINENREIGGKNIYHPLIYECVKNDIYLKNRSVVLTGSNMSGKTSFIRSIGINAITGLTLNTCFAEEFTMPRLRIFSAIRISDDLLNDKSYYFEEVLTIKEMLDQSNDGHIHLFLLDEIFKGTNTIERISAGKAVLSELAKKNIVFVSTHDIELADLLSNEFDLYHFSELVDKNTVDFDYKLKEGKLKNRNAIRILQINNYPEEVIKSAIALSKLLDNKGNDSNNN